MATAPEPESKAADLVKGLGKTLTAITGLVSATCFLPSLPGALLAGMETNPVTADHLVSAPLLFGVSAAASLACIARITILRFAFAVVPFTIVIARWLA
jgi:hypothetical protein